MTTHKMTALTFDRVVAGTEYPLMLGSTNGAEATSGHLLAVHWWTAITVFVGSSDLPTTLSPFKYMALLCTSMAILAFFRRHQGLTSLEMI